MPEYIERETLLKHTIALNNPHELGENVVPVSDIEAAPAADVAEVVHGRWIFTAYSFYRDEDFPAGVAYVMANCSECGGKHPNYAEVYHKTILRPDEYDCVDGWEFDKEAEQRLALEEAEKKRDRLSPYCPNCGCKMDKEDET